ncbi:MAG: phosphatidylglycerol lysyltransferase domain-containing protein [Candidatus Sericytochromatia bacterium]|nr:phosphatidylglycerol lysyltransferase domain-containing protein [Candidatus Sericytochromatia bacterium]
MMPDRELVGSPEELPGEVFRTGGVAFGRLWPEGRDLPPATWVAGVEPWWELARWPDHARQLRGLRRQLARGRRKGLRLEGHWLRQQVPGAVPGEALSDLLVRWRLACAMPPMAFAAASRWESVHREAWLGLAWQGERLVGAALALPRGHGAWCLVHLVRDPAAPQGTVEHLVDCAMRELASAGGRWATLGLMPLEGPIPVWLRRVGPRLEGLFPFEGLSTFKLRFRPHRHRYLLVEHPALPQAFGVFCLLRAFTGVGFLRYAATWLLWRLGRRSLPAEATPATSRYTPPAGERILGVSEEPYPA